MVESPRWYLGSEVDLLVWRLPGLPGVRPLSGLGPVGGRAEEGAQEGEGGEGRLGGGGGREGEEESHPGYWSHHYDLTTVI